MRVFARFIKGRTDEIPKLQQNIRKCQDKTGSYARPNQYVDLTFHVGVLDNKRHLADANAVGKTQLVRQITKKAIGDKIGAFWTKNDDVKNVITHEKSHRGKNQYGSSCCLTNNQRRFSRWSKKDISLSLLLVHYMIPSFKMSM